VRQIIKRSRSGQAEIWVNALKTPLAVLKTLNRDSPLTCPQSV